MIARMPEHLHEPDPLLADAVAGDHEALGRLAERYYPRLRRWALLETGRTDLAEDAVRLAGLLHDLVPGAPQVRAMLALLLTPRLSTASERNITMSKASTERRRA